MKKATEIWSWLRANCGNRCLAPLSSHDTNALLAALAMTPLISWDGARPELFAAFRAIVMEMQPHTRWLVYHGIAMELEWSHRGMIWSNAGLPEGDKPARLAAFEPGGCGRDLRKEAA